MSCAGETRQLLRVHGLVKRFRVGRGGLLGRSPKLVQALGGVSFTVAAQESFGLVGESGCGKSTVARCVLRLTEPTEGTIEFEDRDLLALSDRDLRALRRRMQLVFQDPTGSLDPRMTVGALVREPLDVHRIGDARARTERARSALGRVGLDDSIGRRKPHELSGGQRQRVGIARALVCEPALVVLDEPVSALDVSVQAQVLNLLGEVQHELGLTYVFIVHDLAVAEHFCDRIAVLYLGHIMELGPSRTLFAHPTHPYTVSLLSAVPEPDPERARSRERRIVLQGEVGSPTPGEVGCPFRARCPVGRDRAVCAEQRPTLAPSGHGSEVACHFPGELAA